MITVVLAALGFAVWTWRLGAFVRSAGHRDAPVALPPTSVIVPARDEAANLPALLRSLRALDPAPVDMIVVDDHSTDGTGAIARRGGARVVVPPPLPDGWVGKPWACRAGAEAARGDLLLFTDADTVHAPGSLGRVSARMHATGAPLVTVVPTHIAVRAWEHLQGVFHLLLLIATGPRFAIGQYLLFRRDAYDALGGHSRVHAHIAEDLAFARAAGRHEIVLAPGLLRVRMYPEGVLAFLRGWRRNFRAGIGSSGIRGVVEIALVFAWLLGLPLALVASPSWSLAAFQVLTLVELARRQRLVGEFAWWTVLFAPLALLAFAWCTALALFDHALGRPVTWRGRQVEVPSWRQAG